MRYGTWQIMFSENDSSEGTTPDNFLGLFFINEIQNKIAGYIPENSIIDNYSYWNVVELNQNDFFKLALEKNKNATIDEFGKVNFPYIQ